MNESERQPSAAQPSLLRSLLPLMVVMVLVHLTFTGARVSLTLYAIALHASTVVVGLQVSLLSLLPMLLSVKLGRWIDRVGIKRPARIAIAMATAGAALPAIWPSVRTAGGMDTPGGCWPCWKRRPAGRNAPSGRGWGTPLPSISMKKISFSRTDGSPLC